MGVVIATEGDEKEGRKSAVNPRDISSSIFQLEYK